MGNCNECKYWDREEMQRGNEGLGDCKRFPPAISDHVYVKQDTDGFYDPEYARWVATIYPVTAKRDMCGEWKKG